MTSIQFSHNLTTNFHDINFLLFQKNIIFIYCIFDYNIKDYFAAKIKNVDLWRACLDLSDLPKLSSDDNVRLQESFISEEISRGYQWL